MLQPAGLFTMDKPINLNIFFATNNSNGVGSHVHGPSPTYINLNLNSTYKHVNMAIKHIINNK